MIMDAISLSGCDKSNKTFSADLFFIPLSCLLFSGLIEKQADSKPESTDEKTNKSINRHKPTIIEGDSRIWSGSGIKLRNMKDDPGSNRLLSF